MKFGLGVKGLDEAIKELDILSKGVSPEELMKWSRTIEATAKKLCNDSEDKIVFKQLDGKQLQFSIKDKKSRDCLVKAIETHYDSMPIMLQGFYSLVKHKLINQEEFNQ